VTKKVRTTTHSILIAFVLLAVTVSTVFAAPPMDVHIQVDEFIGGIGVDEPFTASGSAVDAGLICATGMVQDVSVSTSGAPSAPYRIIQVLKRFSCGDGTIDVSMVVQLDLATNYTTASWRVVSGTGNYAGLRGSGSLVGTPIVAGESIHDDYYGNLH
jgi:hypothetical protein